MTEVIREISWPILILWFGSFVAVSFVSIALLYETKGQASEGERIEEEAIMGHLQERLRQDAPPLTIVK